MQETIDWPQQPPPIVLVGPTAVGKTAVAVALAARIGGEIVNADSMQVYRGMDVGTAKPDPEERAAVPFHLIDVVRPDESYNVAEWKAGAERAIVEIAGPGRRAIICGGTGMYVKALLDDWSLARTMPDPDIRARFQAECDNAGSPALHARLAAIDPTTAARLHANDAVRIIRALEVYEATGVPISEYHEQNRTERQSRPAVMFGLTLPREQLYARIGARTDAMIAAGLEAEVRELSQRGYARTLPPMESLGYREMLAYVAGETDLPTVVEEIKKNTRRYAKRQLTWFRADKRITWFDVAGRNSAEVADMLAATAIS